MKTKIMNCRFRVLVVFPAAIFCGIIQQGFGQFCTTGLYTVGCTSGDDVGFFRFNAVLNVTNNCPGSSSGYANYTAISTSVQAGSSYTLKVATSSPTWPQGFGVWIDYNKNFSFNDPGEFIYASPTTAINTTTFVATVTIPSNAPTGSTRLRVRSRYASTISSGQSCSNFNYGECEDYTVTITNNCSALSTNIAIANVSCNGGNDGSATVSASGGASPYSYLWNTGQTTSSINTLSAGNYNVTVTDANGCTVAATATISEPIILSLNISTTDVPCSNACNGSSNAAVSGGALPYSYLWSNGQTGQTANNLCAGNYSVTVTDANGCTASQGLVVNVASGNGVWVQKANFGGIARSNAAGFSIGTKGYIGTGYDGGSFYNDFWEYDPTSDVWTQKSNFGGTPRERAVGFSIGNKGYIGTGSGQKDFWEYDPSGNAWIKKADFGGTGRTGAVGFSIGNKGYIGTGTDGSANGDFWEWDQATDTWTKKTDFGGIPTHRAVGFSIGTKGYIGTGENPVSAQFWEWDQATDVWTQKANVGGPARRNAFGFSIGTKGYISAGTDGSNNLQDFWEWDQAVNVWTQKANFAGGVRAEAVGFSIGTKGFVGTGNDGVHYDDFYEFNPFLQLSAASAQTNATCYGLNDGSATVVASGGTLPYSYLWNTGQTASSINNLSAGNYSVTITDANGCSSVANTSITEPTLLSLSASSQTNVSCNGGNDGAAMVSSSGGTAPYDYQWNNGQTTYSATGLSAGNHYAMVTDANGCTATAAITISEPAPFYISNSSQTNASCNGNCDGTISVSSTGGVMPYTYLWSNGETNTAVSNLCVGNYSVLVTDANGCTEGAGIIITEPSALSIVLNGNSQICSGDTSVVCPSVNGGVPPYNYAWSDGSAASCAFITSSGNYNVVATDLNGCTVTDALAISVYNPMDPPVIIVNDVSCYGGSNGSIDLIVAGGSGNYQYGWSTGDTTQDLFNLSSGTYIVNVMDAVCADTLADTLFVNEPSALSALFTMNDETSCGNKDGSILVTVTGGTGPYTYLWNTGNTTSFITGLSAGAYSSAISDANGCIMSLIDTVNCVTSVENSPLPVNDVSIYPNPAQESIFIQYILNKPAEVHVSLMNMLGDLIMKIPAGAQSAGTHVMSFNMKEAGCSAGIYFIRFENDGAVSTYRIIFSE